MHQGTMSGINMVSERPFRSPSASLPSETPKILQRRTQSASARSSKNSTQHMRSQPSLGSDNRRRGQEGGKGNENTRPSSARPSFTLRLPHAPLNIAVETDSFPSEDWGGGKLSARGQDALSAIREAAQRKLQEALVPPALPPEDKKLDSPRKSEKETGQSTLQPPNKTLGTSKKEMDGQDQDRNYLYAGKGNVYPTREQMIAFLKKHELLSWERTDHVSLNPTNRPGWRYDGDQGWRYIPDQTDANAHGSWAGCVASTPSPKSTPRRPLVRNSLPRDKISTPRRVASTCNLTEIQSYPPPCPISDLTWNPLLRWQSSDLMQRRLSVKGERFLPAGRDRWGMSDSSSSSPQRSPHLNPVESARNKEKGGEVDWVAGGREAVAWQENEVDLSWTQAAVSVNVTNSKNTDTDVETLANSDTQFQENTRAAGLENGSCVSHSLRLFSFHRLDKDRYIISPSLDEHQIMQMTKSWEKGQEERQRPLNSTSPRMRSPRKGLITERSMEKGGTGGTVQRISSNFTTAMPMSTPVTPLPSVSTWKAFPAFRPRGLRSYRHYHSLTPRLDHLLAE